MKNIKSVLLAILFIVSICAMAQSNMEDVVYLKNGSSYRGLIVEQILGESIKIQIAGGSVIAFPVADVYKITKEPVKVEKAEPNACSHHGNEMGYGYHHCMGDTSRKPAYMRNHRFFGTIDFRPGINNIGLRLVRGVKINHFVSLGIGLGVDGVYFGKGISWGKGVYDNKNVNNGLYIPLYLSVSGDMLKARATPFYYVEAGYAFHPANPFVAKNPTDKSWGGPTGAIGLGFKMYSRGRSSMGVSIGGNYRSDIYRKVTNGFDALGNPISITTNGIAGKFFGTLGLSIGF